MAGERGIAGNGDPIQFVVGEDNTATQAEADDGQ
jgi:hypothetical protein